MIRCRVDLVLLMLSVVMMMMMLFQMWLALASLCVLGPDHVERLSSGEWVSSPDSAHGKPRVGEAFCFELHYKKHSELLS